MSFMQPEITEKEIWIMIERWNGESEHLPFNCLGVSELKVGDIVTVLRGYGARMSAPGYLDSTEWLVFDTEFEAIEYLLDTYGRCEVCECVENWEPELEEWLKDKEEST